MSDLANSEQFEDAYRSLAPLARKVAWSVLKDTHAAEEVVQDLFMGLWRNPRAFDPARGPLRAYVLMLARSRALDRWRSRAAGDSAQARLVAETHAASAAGADVETIGRERRRSLLAALSKLPPEQGEALLLAYWRGLTAREIAAGRELPLGTAKSRVRMGLARMRTQLGEAA